LPSFVSLNNSGKGFLLYSLTYANPPMLHILKKTKIVFLNALIFAITSISLNILLIPTYGFTGAAIATSFSYFILSFLSSFFVYRYTKLQPFNRKYIKPMASATISILVAYFITKPFPLLTMHVYGIILVFLFFLLLYSGLLLFFKSFEKEDLGVLKVISTKFRLPNTLKFSWLNIEQ